MWDAATGRELRRVSRTGVIDAFAVTPDGTLSATALRDGGLVLTDLKTGQERQLLRNIPTESLAFSGDSSRLAAVTGDQRVRLFDTVTGEQVRDLGHIDGIQRIAFSPDSTLLATAGREKTVRLLRPCGRQRGCTNWRSTRAATRSRSMMTGRGGGRLGRQVGPDLPSAGRRADRALQPSRIRRSRALHSRQQVPDQRHQQRENPADLATRRNPGKS